MTAPLPRNAELARDILATEGSLSPAQLADHLAERGAHLPPDLLASFPERYPEHFSQPTPGLIDLASRPSRLAEPESDEGDRPEEGWWAIPHPVDSIAMTDIAVLDIETTGLDPGVDLIRQISVRSFDGSERLDLVLENDDETIQPDPAAVRVALETTQAFLEDFKAVAGHSVGSFDLRFLAAVADRVGLNWTPTPAVLDLHLLSVLVEPELPGRTLSDLAAHLSVPLDDAHVARADVDASVGVIEALLSRVDPQSPNWALTRRLLIEADNAWSLVLPTNDTPHDLHEALVPRVDPLAVGSEAVWTSATSAARGGFIKLSDAEPGFSVRQGQADMADAIAATLDRGGQLAVEGPTGVGKSLGYLVPAAGRADRGSHRPVVIATKTKVLQHQLRDEAERLMRAGVLTVPFRHLQGIENYICTRELAATIELKEARGDEWIAVAVAVRGLAHATTGSWADLTDARLAREDKAYAQKQTSLRTTTDSCDRHQCEWVNECPLYSRLDGIDRRPGVLAINHALLGAWAQLADDGRNAPAKALGDTGCVIVDEAHNLEDTLTNAWSRKISGFRLEGVLIRLWAKSGPVANARKVARRLDLDTADLALAADHRRAAVDAVAALGEQVRDYLHEFASNGDDVALLPAVIRSRPEFRALAGHALDTWRALKDLRDPLNGAVTTLRSSDANEARRAARLLRASIEEISDAMELLWELRGLEDVSVVHVLGLNDFRREDEVPDWQYQQIPIDIGEQFRSKIADPIHALVLTSATMTVDDKFDFLAERLGLAVTDADEPESTEELATLRIQSPFDYNRNSAVVLTSHLPLPVLTSEREFCDALASDQVGFLSLSGGRSLGLFAARRRMQHVAARVETKQAELAERGVHLLVQGTESPGEIARQFRSDPGAVVYGLASYWEGFDAPGDTLSYLFIEKAPYPPPSDALTAARQRALADVGRDPFLDYVVPLTAFKIAQGFGRLIRSDTDRGVAILCDRRLQQPSPANTRLLSAIPTSTHHPSTTRDDAWTFALEFVTGERPNIEDALVLPISEMDEIVERLRILPGEEPTAKLDAGAREIFGIECLRPEQLELMRAVLEGRDAMGFLRTGFGKSICFQLPALLHPDRKPTIVVSPLVALIKDQVDELRSLRGLRMVAGVTGRTTGAERTETLRDLADGKIALLYVSPERLVRDPTLRGALSQQDLGCLVVDEAHCVSSWGHDFRPEFRVVVPAVKSFERSPRLGLTATATPEVEADLGATLQMTNPVIIRDRVDRPDIRFRAMEFDSDRDRTRELLRMVQWARDTPGIVYCSRRALTEELAWILREAGVTARAYHAGMVPEQRDAIQDDFLSGTTQIIVSTKAFGMGVNKPDIGWVVHYDLPESLESYAQEAGRAARDASMTGDAVLFFTRRDIARRLGHQKQASPHEDAQLATRLLDAIAAAPVRGEDRVVDPEVLTESLQVDSDVLNVLLGWLETTGHLERLVDCSERGHVTIGYVEPKDPQERREFLDLFKMKLKCRVGARRLIDFSEIEEKLDLDPDQLEATLIELSLRRLVTFHTTRRVWRVHLIRTDLNVDAFERQITRWRALEKRRFGAMQDYARSRTCRRHAIATGFGDEPAACADVPGAELCDVCGESSPPWHAVPLAHVPDPESLVDVERILLQAVRWATRFRDGSYGRVGLKAALQGQETLGEGRPLGAGLLSCPQFGAAKYLRNKGKRLDEAERALIDDDALRLHEVSQHGRTYQPLQLTDRGAEMLGVSR